MVIPEIQNAAQYNRDDLDEILTDLKIITPDGLIEKGEIHIRDGVIVYAGEKPLKEELKTRKRSYFGGALCMSAFVNTHTHLAMNLLRGAGEDVALQKWLLEKIFPKEDKLTGKSVYWGTKLAAAECLSCGIATVNDMYFFPQETFEALKEFNLRAFITRAVMGEDDRRFNEAVQAIREINALKDPLIRMTVSPHSQYLVPMATLERCAQLAVDTDTITHIHASETQTEHEQCKSDTGMTPIQVFEKTGLLSNPTVLAHCVWAEDQDIEILAAKGASVASCPQSNLKLGSGIAPLNKMRAAGVNVTVGTDGAASNNSLSMLKEIRLAALLQKGVNHDASLMEARYALDMGTLNGAKALQINSGEIKAGCSADLVIFSQYNLKASPGIDPLYDVLYAYEDSYIIATYVAGHLAYERKDGSNICSVIGRTGAVDVAEIMAKAAEEAKRLL